MPVLDTSVIIDRIRRGEEINENITEISVLEYPPILRYQKFYGRANLNLALKHQIGLRKLGIQKPIPDLLITLTCMNRKEELMTKDKDFLDIAKLFKLKIKIIE